jgi:FKBP-type peptidyl-prolyl cis-trans isomerase
MRRLKGIRVKDLKLGNGNTATPGRVALVHYDCFLPRGEKCDTSRDEPYPVQLHIGKRRMFPGIERGVVGMAVGGIRSVRVGPQLTYYERKRNPQLPENVALRYEIELLGLADHWDNDLELRKIAHLFSDADRNKATQE